VTDSAAATPEVLLEGRGLVRRYGDRAAVAGVDIT